MKRTFLLFAGLSLLQVGIAQKLNSRSKKKTISDSTTTVYKQLPSIHDPIANKPKQAIDFSKRASDHLMIQYGSDTWLNKPDNIHTKGFSRHFNCYLMLDKPLKSNQKYSIAYGLGFTSSNIFFDKQKVDVAADSSYLPFTDQSGSNHFKKTKLTTIYVTAPFEFRYYAHPENPNKSWKGAVGLKAGFLLKAYTKSKDWQDVNGNSIYGSTYVMKESSKKFFNNTSISITGRVGWGNFSLNADYQVTPVIKSGFGADVHTLSIGLTVSGL